MNRHQFRRRQAGDGIALVALDLVVEAKFLQQPQDALGAGLVEVMDDDHGGSPGPHPFGRLSAAARNGLA